MQSLNMRAICLRSVAIEIVYMPEEMQMLLVVVVAVKY